MLDFEFKDCYDINDLVHIMRLLRAPGGCPWDAEQTHVSIKKNLIEETYEAIEAIDLDDKELMQEELGDVLMQVMLHAQFEAEENVFDFSHFGLLHCWVFPDHQQTVFWILTF